MKVVIWTYIKSLQNGVAKNYCNHNMLVVGVAHDFFIVSAQIYLQSGQLRGVEYISYCILNIVLYQLPKVVETRLGILKNKKNHWLQVSTSRLQGDSSGNMNMPIRIFRQNL